MTHFPLLRHNDHHQNMFWYKAFLPSYCSPAQNSSHPMKAQVHSLTL
ncbi:hypothetical protein [Parablautia muri]